jgi:hypothetical protein
VTAQLQRAGPAEIPLLYAQAGFWYDAFWALSDLIAEHPDNASLSAARAELLEQGGLVLPQTSPQLP